MPQIEGAKTSLELPGIVDEVVTLAEIKTEERQRLPRLRHPHVNP